MEGWLVRNEHVAFRAFLVPIIRHGWVGYFPMLALCAGVAAVRFRRTPLRDVGRSFASHRRLTAARAMR